MELLTPTNILFALGIMGTIFGIYHYFKNPQIRQDQDTIKMLDRVVTLEKSVIEIREKHLASVEGDLKSLNTTLQELSRTVVKLSTIIDERIPKLSVTK